MLDWNSSKYLSSYFFAVTDYLHISISSNRIRIKNLEILHEDFKKGTGPRGC
jgi:hypothetical protein